jgi:hypothetical protein
MENRGENASGVKSGRALKVRRAFAHCARPAGFGRMDIAVLQQALAAPPGAHPELIAPALEAGLANRLPRELAGHPEKLDGLLRHLTGGRSWTPELMKSGAMASDWLLELGFRDGAFSDLEVCCTKNDGPASRILNARLGSDSAETLLALSDRAPADRLNLKHAALCAAIANGALAPGIEATLDLGYVPNPALKQKALAKLGPERAGEVLLRAMRRLDNEPQFRTHALPMVLDCFGAPMSAATLDALGERIERLRAETYEHMGWESIGDWLANSRAWNDCIAFIRSRLAKAEGWRLTMRALLGKATEHGFALDPSLDEFIDPAGAAQLSFDVWRVTARLLWSIPAERSASLLLEAKYQQPSDLFRFVFGGLPASALERIAAIHVSLRDDAASKNLLLTTDLKPYGPGMLDALKLALAEVKPKAGYLKHLERNLDPASYAALVQWLAERPEPKKKKAPAKKK